MSPGIFSEFMYLLLPKSSSIIFSWIVFFGSLILQPSLIYLVIWFSMFYTMWEISIGLFVHCTLFCFISYQFLAYGQSGWKYWAYWTPFFYGFMVCGTILLLCRLVDEAAKQLRFFFSHLMVITFSSFFCNFLGFGVGATLFWASLKYGVMNCLDLEKILYLKASAGRCLILYWFFLSLLWWWEKGNFFSNRVMAMSS